MIITDGGTVVVTAIWCCRKRCLQLVLAAIYCVGVPSLWEIKPGNGAWCDRQIMLGKGHAGREQRDR